MSRTLADLTKDFKAIMDEADALWEKDWKPRFQATMTEKEFSDVHHAIMIASECGSTDSSLLPGGIPILIIFEMDAFRQRTQNTARVKSAYGDGDFKPGY